MTTPNQELYEALLAAGAPDEAAKRAAASVLSHEQRADLVTKADLRAELAELRTEIKTELVDVRTDIERVRTEIERMGRIMLMWMVGIAVAGMAAMTGILIALLRVFAQ